MELVYQTLGFVRALASLVVGLAFAYALRGALARREIQFWVAAYACTFVGASLYLVPEVGPGVHLGNYLGRNSFLALSAGLHWVGSDRLRPAPRLHGSAALLPPVLLALLVAFLKASFPGRALAFSLAIAPFLLATAWNLGKLPAGVTRSHARLAALLLILHAAFYLARGIAMVGDPAESNLLVWTALSFGVALILQAALALLFWLVLEAHLARHPVPGGPEGAPVD